MRTILLIILLFLALISCGQNENEYVSKIKSDYSGKTLTKEQRLALFDKELQQRQNALSQKGNINTYVHQDSINLILKKIEDWKDHYFNFEDLKKTNYYIVLNKICSEHFNSNDFIKVFEALDSLEQIKLVRNIDKLYDCSLVQRDTTLQQFILNKLRKIEAQSGFDYDWGVKKINFLAQLKSANYLDSIVYFISHSTPKKKNHRYVSSSFFYEMIQNGRSKEAFDLFKKTIKNDKILSKGKAFSYLSYLGDRNLIVWFLKLTDKNLSKQVVQYLLPELETINLNNYQRNQLFGTLWRAGNLTISQKEFIIAQLKKIANSSELTQEEKKATLDYASYCQDDLDGKNAELSKPKFDIEKMRKTVQDLGIYDPNAAQYLGWGNWVNGVYPRNQHPDESSALFSFTGKNVGFTAFDHEAGEFPVNYYWLMDYFRAVMKDFIDLEIIFYQENYGYDGSYESENSMKYHLYLMTSEKEKIYKIEIDPSSDWFSPIPLLDGINLLLLDNGFSKQWYPIYYGDGSYIFLESTAFEGLKGVYIHPVD